MCLWPETGIGRADEVVQQYVKSRNGSAGHTFIRNAKTDNSRLLNKTHLMRKASIWAASPKSFLCDRRNAFFGRNMGTRPKTSCEAHWQMICGNFLGRRLKLAFFLSKNIMLAVLDSCESVLLIS